MNVGHIAKLANIPLLPGEEEQLLKQFTETLKAVEVINELDTEGIEPTSQVTGLLNVLRPDEIESTRILPPPPGNNGYFVVPAIFNAQ